AGHQPARSSKGRNGWRTLCTNRSPRPVASGGRKPPDSGGRRIRGLTPPARQGKDPMSESLVVVAVLLTAGSGVPGLFFSRISLAGQRLATFLLVLGAAFGLGGCAHSFFGAASEPLVFPWSVPGGEFAIAVDGLSALFLVPVFLVALLGSVYGLSYW